MEQITKTFQVYAFKELGKEIQEKVITRIRNLKYEDDWMTESIDENFKEILSERGLPTKTAWSLSYSQGDGVAFYGDIDLEKFLKFYRKYKYFNKLFNGDIHAKIEGEHSRGYGMNAIVDYEDNFEEYDDELRQALIWLKRKELNKLYEELQSFVEDKVMDVSKELENIGYKELDYQYSDECIIEEIEDKDERFLEDGERWN